MRTHKRYTLHARLTDGTVGYAYDSSKNLRTARAKARRHAERNERPQVTRFVVRDSENDNVSVGAFRTPYYNGRD